METNTATSASTSTAELKIDAIKLKLAALVYRAINHALRQRILQLIHQNGSITVTEIYEQLRLEQSVVSQHLAILRKAGIVQSRRDGKNKHYSVVYERIAELETHAKDLLLKDS